MNLKHWIKQLYLLPPEKSLKKIRKKVFGDKEKGIFAVDDVIGSKYMRGQRMTDFLVRYKTIVQRHHPLWNLDFNNKKVLEIGGGPVLGWAPLAIFLGCRRYVHIEPMYNPKILEHPNTKKLFMYIYKDLIALYGERMSFTDFLKALDEKVVVRKMYLEDFTGEDGFEIVLSNSTLEHIGDLDQAFKQLKKITVDGSAFLHLVDFGNHKSEQVFSGVYDRTPEEYFKQHGNNLNLLKPSDMLKLLNSNGLPAELIPYYHMEYTGAIHEYWAQRYNEDELFLKVCLFVNKV
jgi:hypothetical protein